MKPNMRVLIRTGAHGGREGVVVSTRPSLHPCRLIVNVRLTAPALILDPDGPTREIELPYAPDELEVLS